MINVKIKGLENLAKDLRTTAEKELIEEARKAGVHLKIFPSGEVVGEGDEDAIKRFFGGRDDMSIEGTDADGGAGAK